MNHIFLTKTQQRTCPRELRTWFIHLSWTCLRR